MHAVDGQVRHLPDHRVEGEARHRGDGHALAARVRVEDLRGDDPVRARARAGL